jgi:hypothetical protein
VVRKFVDARDKPGHDDFVESSSTGSATHFAEPDRRGNAAALRCSEAAGFRRLRTFIEDGIETALLAAER